MKKRVKIFETGKYPQGEYPIDRVKKIFGEVKDGVKAIFQHTSKWKQTGKKPVLVGEFGNIQVDEAGKVFADIEFNDKGNGYFEDGILTGISVEIPDDKLTAISVLPVGVKPAVKGAEFEDQSAFFIEAEFEDITGGVTVVTKEEIITALAGLTLDDKIAILKAISGGITDEQKKAMRTIVYGEFEEKEEPKTEDQIRAEVAAEFEEKAERKNRVDNFLTDNKLKITPAMKKAGMEEFCKILVEDTAEKEFSADEKITAFEKLEKIFEAMPTIINIKEVFGNGKKEEAEFEKKESAYEKAYKGEE